MIRALIQEAESRKDGYDVVQHGARIKPAKRPTRMTLEELLAWIDATPGQPHAIGRYQFIPKTLRRLIEKTGAKLSQRFDPKMQDQLADVLLAEAGLQKFRAGTLERQAFMNNMAKIWAGLPTSNGKSHYDGYAGNKAMVTWARFDAVMARISPKQS
jgi:muramidase (phage lysozyme)